MARLLVTSCLVFLLLAAWTDVAVSKKGTGKPTGCSLLVPSCLVFLLLAAWTDVAVSKKGKGGYHNQKPWKPPKSKTNFKHVAGAAAAGAVVGGLGGYAMGRVMSGMHYHFDSPDEYRWWNQNAARYPNQVYYRDYNGPVSQDVFVTDCFNITVTEHNIGPAAKKNVSEAAAAVNQTETEMETKVVTKVIREMCIQQYREYLMNSGIRLHVTNACLTTALLLLTLFILH
ncbi:PREDICTED: major prion protein homolog [Buceros rhinoceros silvestris]|uniref:major prion protein homolog n=1 Tax=Buceros rhinoceros silvestris TaxID=175836 RepID=UPI000528D371|nr:PREDICTED: major prion protein homolog [Buceros rhinoceros silvestris]